MNQFLCWLRFRILVRCMQDYTIIFPPLINLSHACHSTCHVLAAICFNTPFWCQSTIQALFFPLAMSTSFPRPGFVFERIKSIIQPLSRSLVFNLLSSVMISLVCSLLAPNRRYFCSFSSLSGSLNISYTFYRFEILKNFYNIKRMITLGEHALLFGWIWQCGQYPGVTLRAQHHTHKSCIYRGIVIETYSLYTGYSPKIGLHQVLLKAAETFSENRQSCCT